MKLPAASCCAMVLLTAANLAAQVVELPSFQSFGTSTTVVVPDRGAASLGGINSAASGQNQFGGLPGNRSRSTTGQATSATVTAYVHDFDAWDQALLAEAARRRKAAGLAEPEQRSNQTLAGGSSATSVAEIEARRRAARPDPEREAENYFSRARQAEETGKPRSARVYYQMAARRASGELKQRALAQIEAIGQVVGSADVGSATKAVAR